MLLEPVSIDKSNAEQVLLDAKYYTEEQMASPDHCISARVAGGTAAVTQRSSTLARTADEPASGHGRTERTDA